MFLKRSSYSDKGPNNFYYKVIRSDLYNNKYSGITYINEVGLKKFSNRLNDYDSTWDLGSKMHLDIRNFIVLKKGMKLILKNIKGKEKNQLITVIDPHSFSKRLQVKFINENNEEKIFDLKYLMKKYLLINFQHLKNVYFLNSKTIKNFSKNDPSFHLNSSLEFFYDKNESINIKQIKKNDLLIIDHVFDQSNFWYTKNLVSVENVFLSNFCKDDSYILVDKVLNLTFVISLIENIEQKIDFLKEYNNRGDVIIKEIKSSILKIQKYSLSIDSFRISSLSSNVKLAKKSCELENLIKNYNRTKEKWNKLKQTLDLNIENINFNLIEDVIKPFIY